MRGKPGADARQTRGGCEANPGRAKNEPAPGRGRTWGGCEGDLGRVREGRGGAGGNGAAIGVAGGGSLRSR